MAVVKFSGLVSEVKGKLNGSCFQGFREKTVLRNKPIKRTTHNASSTNVRNYNKLLAMYWRQLSEQQRKYWNENSTPGSSGYNEFYKRNFFALMFGTGLIQDYPFDANNPVASDFSVQVQAGNVNLILDTAPVFPDEIVIIKATPIINGTTDHKNFNLSILIAEASATGIIRIDDEWLSRYGHALQPDDRLLIEVVKWNRFNGLSSLPVRKYVSVYEWVFYLDTEISVPALLVASYQKLISDYSGDCLNVMNYDTENISPFGFVNRVFDYAGAKTWLGAHMGLITDVFNQVTGGSAIWQYVKDNMPMFYNGASAFASLNDSIRCLAIDKFSSTVGQNFSMWFKFYIDVAYGNDYCFIDDSDPAVSAPFIVISAPNTIIGITDSLGNYVYNDSVNITTGVHTFCLTKQGDNYKIYWDNVLKVDDSISGSQLDFDIILGSIAMGNLEQNILLKHFLLFNDVLTAADRLALNNNL